MNVARIREKVEAGERLSDEELSLLERAAIAQGSPGLRAAVGQALINADEVDQAVAVLERARRDFPADVQVLLGLARAYISVERWSAAEEPLVRALRVNPKDLEVMKSLAVVAMRRAEWSRASALINDVLAEDPLDSEAQQLAGELAHAAPPAEQSESRVTSYTRALVDALRARSMPHLVQRNFIFIRAAQGNVVRLDIDALFTAALRDGQSIESAAQTVATAVTDQAAMPTNRQGLVSKVLPVIRDSRFLERGVGSVRREGPEGLWVFYAIDDPELVRYVPQGTLDELEISLDELDQAAWKNLLAKPAEVRALELEHGALRLSTQPTGLWAFAHGDGHDAARLLTTEHQQAIANTIGAGPFRVYLGLRELVLFCEEKAGGALEKLKGLESTDEGIEGVWRLEEQRLRRVSDWE